MLRNLLSSSIRTVTPSVGNRVAFLPYAAARTKYAWAGKTGDDFIRAAFSETSAVVSPPSETSSESPFVILQTETIQLFEPTVAGGAGSLPLESQAEDYWMFRLNGFEDEGCHRTLYESKYE